MQEKKTDELNELLETMKPEQLDTYFRDNAGYLVEDKRAFYSYMKHALEKKNIRLKDLYSFAGVTESYGGKILTMEKHTKDRDLIIRFCVAGHLGWEETSRALKLYGFNELYAKDPRDAVIIVAINNRIFNLSDIDGLLLAHGLTGLSAEEQS